MMDEHYGAVMALVESAFNVRPGVTTDLLGRSMDVVLDGLHVRLWHPDFDASSLPGEGYWILQVSPDPMTQGPEICFERTDPVEMIVGHLLAIVATRP